MNKSPTLTRDRRSAEGLDAPGGGSDRRSGIDRRQHERVAVDWSVDYRADDTFLFAYISDISAMGIFVRTPRPEPPGTKLNLRFSPPGGPALDLEGKVIWVNPPREDGDPGRQPGMGLEFVDLTAGQRDQILRLVRTFAYLDDEAERLASASQQRRAAVASEATSAKAGALAATQACVETRFGPTT